MPVDFNTVIIQYKVNKKNCFVDYNKLEPYISTWGNK